MRFFIEQSIVPALLSFSPANLKRSHPNLSPSEARRSKPAVGSVFCLLDSWAIDKRQLHLDLPQEFFSQPGRIRVWFMREGAVIWAETLDWPGYKS